jgi:hypothetical protein
MASISYGFNSLRWFYLWKKGIWRSVLICLFDNHRQSASRNGLLLSFLMCSLFTICGIISLWQLQDSSSGLCAPPSLLSIKLPRPLTSFICRKKERSIHTRKWQSVIVTLQKRLCGSRRKTRRSSTT